PERHPQALGRAHAQAARRGRKIRGLLSLPGARLAASPRGARGPHGGVKAELGQGTGVLGYADDMISYIPSRRVWLEGGYEGGPNLYEYGRPALRWSGDIEDRIGEAMKKLVKSVDK